MKGASDAGASGSPCPSKHHKPVSACGGYVWNYYKNTGGALASTPVTIIAPVPLESNNADSSLGARRSWGFSSQIHAVIDLEPHEWRQLPEPGKKRRRKPEGGT